MMKNCLKISCCLSLLFYITLLKGQGNFFTQGEGGVFTSDRLAVLKGPHGETAGIGNNPSMLNLYSDMRVKFGRLGEEVVLSLTDIDGSIYLQDEFVLGTLYDKDIPFKRMYLRFDAYNDEIQLKNNVKSEKIEALVKSQNFSCSINEEKYKYKIFVDAENYKKAGYLIALHEERNYSLYVRKIKIFKEGKQAKTSLQNSFPHRFQDKTEFYISISNMHPQFFKRTKREVLNLFDEKDNVLIRNYIKDNGIDLKKIDDLVNLFKYANNIKTKL